MQVSARLARLLCLPVALMVAASGCSIDHRAFEKADPPVSEPANTEVVNPVWPVRGNESLALHRQRLREQYRPHPDRRVLRAIGEIHHFFSGKPISTVSLTFDKGKWQIEYQKMDVGTLDEIPTFNQSFALLKDWAKRVKKQFPYVDKGSISPSPELDRSINEGGIYDLLGAADEIERRWQAGELGLPLIIKASDLLTLLALQTVDILEVADSIFGKALAMTAIGEASLKDGGGELREKDAGEPSANEVDAGDRVDADSRRRLARNRCLMAIAMGHLKEAAKQKDAFANNDALSLFLHKKEKELSALMDSKGDRLSRLLYLRLVSANHDYKEGLVAIRAMIAKDRSLTLPALSSLIPSVLPGTGIPLASNILWATSAQAARKAAPGERIDLDNLKWRYQEEDISEDLVSESVVSDYAGAVSSLQKESTAVVFTPDVFAGYFNAYWCSGVYLLVAQYLNLPAAKLNCDRLVRSLSKVDRKPVADLSKWLEMRVKWRSTRPPESDLRNDLLRFSSLGTPARAALFVDSGSYLDVRSPFDRHGAALALFQNADSRPSNLITLGQIAEQSLLYFRLAKQLYKASVLTGTRFSYDYRSLGSPLEFLAALIQLTEVMRREGVEAEARRAGYIVKKVDLRALDQLNPRARLTLLEAVEGRISEADIDKQYRSIVADSGKKWWALSNYSHWLIRKGKAQQAADTVSSWLASSKSMTEEEKSSVGALLAECDFKLGRQADGLKRLQPYLESEDLNCLKMHAILLQATGKADDAMRVADELLLRAKNEGAPVALACSIYWLNEQYRISAAKLAKCSLNAKQWDSNIVPVFLSVFRKDDRKLEQAVKALQAAGLGPGHFSRLARGAYQMGRKEQALKILAMTDPASGQEIDRIMAAYACIRDLKSRDSALDWLKSKVPFTYRSELAPLAFASAFPEVLWSVVPTDSALTKSGPDFERMKNQSEEVWLLRAALAAERRAPVTPKEKGQLIAHFKDDRSSRGTIGRFLTGQTSIKEVESLTVTDRELPRFAFYTGVKEIHRGSDFLDASEWCYLSAVSAYEDKWSTWSWRELTSMETANLSYHISLETIEIPKMFVIHRRSKNDPDLPWIDVILLNPWWRTQDEQTTGRKAR